MTRTEKRVALRIMKRPCSLADLFREIGLPAFVIRQAVMSLLEAGDIQFCNDRFYINRGES